MPAQRPIIVLGAERSGTSVVAEAVHLWGAYAGEAEDLPEPDSRNARGRWEFLPLWGLLAEVGRFSKGVSWWDESFPQLVHEQVRDPALIAKARELVAYMERPGRPWMWKDPAVCHFLPFWLRVWQDPVFVVTVRDPIDVALSWCAFTSVEGIRTDPEVNLLRWQRTMLNILTYTDGWPDRHFIAYESLMADPVTHVTALARHLDRMAGPGPQRDPVAQMARACDPDLWHKRPSGDRDVQLSPTQRRLYELLLTLIEEPASRFVADEYPMQADWRRLVQSQDTAAAPPVRD